MHPKLAQLLWRNSSSTSGSLTWSTTIDGIVWLHSLASSCYGVWAPSLRCPTSIIWNARMRIRCAFSYSLLLCERLAGGLVTVQRQLHLLAGSFPIISGYACWCFWWRQRACQQSQQLRAPPREIKSIHPTARTDVCIKDMHTLEEMAQCTTCICVGM